MIVSFWLTLGLAAWNVWQSFGADERARDYYLLGAVFLVIHAYGRRILSTLEANKTKAGSE